MKTLISILVLLLLVSIVAKAREIFGGQFMKSFITVNPNVYFFLKEVLFTSNFKSINFRLLFVQLLKEIKKIIQSNDPTENKWDFFYMYCVAFSVQWD